MTSYFEESGTTKDEINGNSLLKAEASLDDIGVDDNRNDEGINKSIAMYPENGTSYRLLLMYFKMFKFNHK